ncbi:unnamed protein product [Sphagnum tenellum]
MRQVSSGRILIRARHSRPVQLLTLAAPQSTANQTYQSAALLSAAMGCAQPMPTAPQPQQASAEDDAPTTYPAGSCTYVDAGNACPWCCTVSDSAMCNANLANTTAGAGYWDYCECNGCWNTLIAAWSDIRYLINCRFSLLYSLPIPSSQRITYRAHANAPTRLSRPRNQVVLAWENDKGSHHLVKRRAQSSIINEAARHILQQGDNAARPRAPTVAAGCPITQAAADNCDELCLNPGVDFDSCQCPDNCMRPTVKSGFPEGDIVIEVVERRPEKSFRALVPVERLQRPMQHRLSRQGPGAARRDPTTRESARATAMRAERAKLKLNLESNKRMIADLANGACPPGFQRIGSKCYMSQNVKLGYEEGVALCKSRCAILIEEKERGQANLAIGFTDWAKGEPKRRLGQRALRLLHGQVQEGVERRHVQHAPSTSSARSRIDIL